MTDRLLVNCLPNMSLTKFPVVHFMLIAFGIIRVLAFSFLDDVGFDKSVLQKDSGFLTCSCGAPNEKLDIKPVDTEMTKNILFAASKYEENFSEFMEAYPVAAVYAVQCSWCQLAYIQCRKISNTSAFSTCTQDEVDFVVTVTLEDENMDVRYPKVIIKRNRRVFPKVIYFSGGDSADSRRHIRDLEDYPNSCKLPKQEDMKTYSLYCVYYPVYMRCTQLCHFGHTLPTGIKHVTDCEYAVNYWEPAGFYECRPFVDCTLKLGVAGRLKCGQASVGIGPQCTVECYPFDIFKGTPPKNYTCQIDGSWKPELPHCAVPANGNLYLEQAPNVTLHETL